MISKIHLACNVLAETFGSKIIISNTNIDTDDSIFFKAIHLKEETAILSYYSDANLKKLSTSLIKKLLFGYYYELKDYITIYTNVQFTNEGYSHLWNLNNLIKISDTEFCLVSSSDKKHELIMTLFFLYNNDKNVNINYCKTNFNIICVIKSVRLLKIRNKRVI